MNYIKRSAEATLKRLAKGFPLIGITGPRQSGKTTLAKAFFSKKPYVSLEDPQQLDFASTDPEAFLRTFPKGAIIDEVQKCSLLFSYLQLKVDKEKKMGQFVLTGSQQFGFKAKVTQSLAGRIGLLELLPFSLEELKINEKNNLYSLIYSGLYPPLYDRSLKAGDWHSNYMKTYIERDLHQLIHVKNMSLFKQFLKLCAGRTGQLLNFSDISNNCGVSSHTIREWISILEASYIIYRLLPHFNNFSKRMIKSSKIYFYDTGVACFLLGLNRYQDLSYHSLRGPLFENFIINEFMKSRFNDGKSSNLYFWRNRKGVEIDLLIENGEVLFPIEIKSAQTLNADFFKSLNLWRRIAEHKTKKSYLIYAGNKIQKMSYIEIYPWFKMKKVLELC